jgi:two-component system OmpR family sensor kinase
MKRPLLFRSLYSKLAAVLTGLFCLVGISFVAVTLYSTEMYQQEVNQKLNSELAQHIANEKLLMQNRRINEKALEEVFHMLMVINPSIEIYLLDPQGTILAFSAPPGKVKRHRVDVQPIKAWLEGNVNLPVLGDDPRDLHGKKAFTVARIPKQGRLEAYLYVILGGEAYEGIVQKLKGSFILKLSTWVIVGSILFALIAGLFLFAMLTGRLRRLAGVMEAFKRGERLNQSDLPVQRGRFARDEIDLLSSTFKQMAERIEAQIEQLRKSDVMRRELVANVSHDLRTPLATLQGYIETLLLKEDSLTEKERRNYLEIAIKHCTRLNELVSELFELAKLDSDEISPHREAFNLSELVQDVIQKFQLRAEEKHITIITDIEKELPFVDADIALIERALENLIGNALHNTPKGGSISLVLRPEKEDISVQVIDTGQGIPEEELPHIFNRFYQSGRSRKGEPRHSGLGLAITKKILELHNRSIEVTSVLNVGTTFTFQVPVYALT